MSTNKFNRPRATKFWITKYAFTKGVVVCMGDVGDRNPNMVVVEWEGGLNGENCFYGEDWHRSSGGAESHFLKMIENKRKSLVKQLKKLDILEDSSMKIVDTTTKSAK